MRTAAASLLVLSFLLLAGPSRADEGLDAKADRVVSDLLSDDADRAAAAEKEIAAASPDLLRALIACLRDLARGDVVFAPPLPAPAPVPIPAPAPPGPAPEACGGPADEAGPGFSPLAPRPAPPGDDVPKDARLVTIETRFLDVDEPAAKRLGIRDTGSTPSRVLEEAEVERILAAIEEESGIVQITAPTITVYDRQRANVSIANRVSYIQDYDVEKGPDGSQVADPVVGVVEEGALLEVRPALSEDGAQVVLDADLTVRRLRRPIEQFETTLAGGKVIIQLPEVTINRIQRKIPLPVGRTVLLAGLKFYEGDDPTPKHVVVLLRTEALEPADLSPSNFVPPQEEK